MNRKVLMIVVAVVIAVLLTLTMFTFQVEFYEQALVETFGEVSGPVGAGRHFRWPWPIQRVVIYDTRQHLLESAHQDATTKDSNKVVITSFVSWRITDPILYQRQLGDSMKEAENQLNTLLTDETQAAIGEHPLNEFVSTTAKDQPLRVVANEIRDRVNKRAEQYGIQVVTVGIKRLAAPEEVSARIITNMQEERKAKAEEYRKDGEAKAKAITSGAETMARQILSFADLKAAEIRARGDAEAGKYYRSYQQYEEFAIFLRQLDFLEVLKKNTKIVLDGSSLDKSLGWLRNPPQAADLMPPVSTGAVSPTTRPNADAAPGER